MPLPPKTAPAALDPRVAALHARIAELEAQRAALLAQRDADVGALQRRVADLEGQLRTALASNKQLAADAAALRRAAASQLPPSPPMHPQALVTASLPAGASGGLPSPRSPEPRQQAVRRAGCPDAASQWDRLPREMQLAVLGRASILTQVITGHARTLSDAQFAALWAEVFASEWAGDLARLPVDRFRTVPWFAPFWHLSTRAMHARVRALGHGFLADGLAQAAICNWWTDMLDFGRPHDLALNAARCGSIAMLRHLADERRAVVLGAEHAQLAAWGEHLALLQWLAARMPDGAWTPQVLDWAVCSDRLECARWLHANRSEGCTVDAMDDAAKYGYLAAVQFLHANRSEGCTTKAMDGAAARGHLKVVAFLHKNRAEGCTAAAMTAAAANGYADVVEFLHTHRTEGRLADAALAAARAGRVGVLQRVRTLDRTAITPAVADAAAAGGSDGVLNWLVGSAGVRPTADAIGAAVAGGHLWMLPWLRSVLGSVFDSHPMARIGARSAAGVLGWLARDDLPTDPRDVLRAAIREARIEPIRWLLWHMPDTPWHAGDADVARGLMRIM
ncbi:hypothetical protein HK105_201767 [Polyrhizophydium stewartii]|uniref:Ankyrin repeat protein n=1 Tax=Polyrhizophydium stewartii TaxID=2732419 RepID=A0ABR4NHC3_9FUNG